MTIIPAAAIPLNEEANEGTALARSSRGKPWDDTAD